MLLESEHTVITMKTPVPKKGSFFSAVHRCATTDGLMPRVLDALGIGPAMGSRNEGDLVQFDLLARTALFNRVPGKKEERMRILDPSAALRRSEVEIAMEAFCDAGVPCVLHSLSDLIRDKTTCVLHGLNLYRHTPSLPPTEASLSDDDDDAWKRDHYGCMPMSNDDDIINEQEHVARTAASTIVRLPRALLAPFAEAVRKELGVLGIDCNVAKSGLSSLQCLSDTLVKQAAELRNDNQKKMVTITSLKAKQSRMDAEIVRVTAKTADTYAALLIAREDAAESSTKLRAECSVLASEAASVAARRAATDAALRVAHAAAARSDEELSAATERAEVRAALAKAAMDHMEEDRMAAASDIACMEGLTQAAMCLAAEARVERAEAQDNLDKLKARNVRVKDEATELLAENSRIHMELDTLTAESEIITNVVERLRPDVQAMKAEMVAMKDEMMAMKAELPALQAEKDKTYAARATLDDHLRQRKTTMAWCGKVRREIEEIKARHSAAVRARLHALNACRQAESQAAAAARDMASMEAAAADHKARASRVRDKAAEAESDAFRACIELDLASGSTNTRSSHK
jgi:hypothetical protein